MKCSDCPYMETEEDGRSVCTNVFSDRYYKQVWSDGKDGCEEG